MSFTFAESLTYLQHLLNNSIDLEWLHENHQDNQYITQEETSPQLELLVKVHQHELKFTFGLLWQYVRQGWSTLDHSRRLSHLYKFVTSYLLNKLIVLLCLFDIYFEEVKDDLSLHYIGYALPEELPPLSYICLRVLQILLILCIEMLLVVQLYILRKEPQIRLVCK